MKKVMNKLKSLIPSKRKLIQLYSALLFNANIKGFFTGDIYKGASKNFCAPGINCYSCPGAVGACPLGSLQNALGSQPHSAAFYVIGILMLYALLLGRFICGFLCPFGLVQELLYKIKTPKLKKSKVTRILSYLKYVILVYFVIIVPVFYILYSEYGTQVPAFCKYICPAGILEGALLLTPFEDKPYISNLGPLFTWKFCLFVGIIIGSIFIFRFFCRFLCPLGALYGLFNHFSVFGIKLEKSKCTDCGLCISKCKVDIRHVNDHECINCGECIEVCPTQAISWKGSKIILPPNEIDNPIVITDSSTEEEKQAAEIQKQEFLARNEKIKKRNKILKIVTASIMGVVLLFALIYFNFIDVKETQAPGGNGGTLPPGIPPTISGSTTSSTPPTDSSDTTVSSAPSTDSSDTTVSSTPSTDSDDTTASSKPSDDQPIDPPIVLPPVGNQGGNLCYSYPMEVFDENGKTGATIDPVATGKITIINFWGTWCGSCKAELPDFDRIATEYKDTVTVVAVHTHMDFDTAPDYVLKNYKNSNMVFAKDNPIDPSDDYSDEVLFKALGGGDAYPITIILDENGVIVSTILRATKYTELKSIVDATLNK